MKKFFRNAMNKLEALSISVMNAISNQRGEGYVDTGIKILIAVVIGALLLAGLYALFNDVIMKTVTEKIQELFNYKG